MDAHDRWAFQWSADRPLLQFTNRELCFADRIRPLRSLQ